MDPALRELLQRIQPRTVLLLGASDTGKTTLVERLLTTWDPGEPIAIVDCDVGQSRIGPPTTVSVGLLTQPFTTWRHLPVQGMSFTGALSPEGNLETFLDAAARMVARARQLAARIVVDTTGLIQGQLGLTLKVSKIQLINPDLIIALQWNDELKEILSRVTPKAIEGLPASPEFVRRTLAQRAAYRNEAFARYFATSKKHSLPLKSLIVRGIGPDWPTGQITVSPASLMNRVISVRNAQGDDLALGLLRDLERERQTVEILSPIQDCSSVTTLVVGSLRWPTDEAETA